MDPTLPPVDPRDHLDEEAMHRIGMFATQPAGAVALLTYIADAIEVVSLSPWGRQLSIDLHRAVARYHEAILRSRQGHLPTEDPGSAVDMGMALVGVMEGWRHSLDAAHDGTLRLSLAALSTDIGRWKDRLLKACLREHNAARGS